MTEAPKLVLMAIAWPSSSPSRASMSGSPATMPSSSTPTQMSQGAQTKVNSSTSSPLAADEHRPNFLPPFAVGPVRPPHHPHREPRFETPNFPRSITRSSPLHHGSRTAPRRSHRRHAPVTFWSCACTTSTAHTRRSLLDCELFRCRWCTP